MMGHPTIDPQRLSLCDKQVQPSRGRRAASGDSRVYQGIRRE
jgi:hypothetical protein